MKIYPTRFKPRFRCEVIPSEGVLLLSEKEDFLLSGETYIRVAPLLNGQHTIVEIVEHLQSEMSLLEALFFLDKLRQQGYIADTHPSIPSGQAAFWDMLDIAPADTLKRLQAVSISVTSFGDIDIAPFKTMLESLGICVVEQGERWVVLTDDYLQEGLEAFNRQALMDNRQWMLVKPVGTEIWVGPIFIPGKTGCWECLRHRLRGTRKVESYLQQKKNTTKPFPTSFAVLPSTLQTALGIAATETAKWVVAETNPCLKGNILTLDTLTLEKRHHVLVRRPQCLSCGEPNLVSTRQSAPFVLQSCKKSFTTDGGHRSVPPEETFKRFEHHISPITGIVGDLRRTSTWENENGLTPSYIGTHNFVSVNHGLDSLRASLRSHSAGKGKSNIQAKVSALCETIEHYAGRFQGDEAGIRSKLKNLSNAVHPNDCMLFSERQVENREQWNARGSRLTWVPEPFDEEMEIEWSPVWSLTYNELRYVPTAYCYYGYAQQYNIQFTRADSNGCATGNIREEAILQGFMELVERDCVALWWYNSLKKPAVDLSSFDDPYVQELADYYKRLNRDLWVLDITSDVHIPAFAAISCRNDYEGEYIILGFGAHFDPQIAMLRALTEVNQSLAAVKMAERGRNYRQHKCELHQWWNTATIKNQPYLTPDETAIPKVQADYPRYWSDDLYTDVMNCVKIAEAKGLETLILDQTRPDIGLDAVKVIVPGLRHFWPRFAPGRLYDVPVTMGWLTQPLTEEQLNPQPIFF